VTPDRIDQVAGDIADAGGLPALTLSAVAAEFGVSVPSLYKHVDGLDGMRRRLTLKSLDELGDLVASAAVGKAREDALIAVCDAYRRFAVVHPGRYAATVAAPATGDSAHEAGARRVLTPVLAVLAGYGLQGSQGVDAARFVRSALHGFVVLQQSHGFGLPQDVDASFSQLVAAVGRALSDWPAASKAPQRRKRARTA
jgi:AcrR family transcriptional regulator